MRALEIVIALLIITGLLTSCGQVQFESIDASVEIGDSGTQAVYEGGVLSPYRCTRDPAGKADIGVDSGAPMQIWLDGTQLFNCYGETNPPCHGMGDSPTLYDCRTKDLEP